MEQLHGLKQSEVTESREKYGSNVIPDSEPTTFWKEFRETFQDPMIRILVAIALLMIVMFFFGMHRFMNRWEPSWQFWWLLL